jgi:hypothetical protein
MTPSVALDLPLVYGKWFLRDPPGPLRTYSK